MAEDIKIKYPDFEDEFCDIYNLYKEYCMSSPERMYALYKAVIYIINSNIPGDIVECGVWKGGNCMIIAAVLKQMGITDKKIYLYDTFTGMSEPTEKDISYRGGSVASTWKVHQREGYNELCYSPLEEVINNLRKIDYPQENFIFVKGKVEDTLTGTVPEQISLLRLDTDWYESTLCEMIYLYPKLSIKGILIIDDYGHWKGAKIAVDNYLKDNNIKMYLGRMDYTGRIAVKP